MAKEVVAKRGIAIRLACQVFTISESCFRHEGKKNADNQLIANCVLLGRDLFHFGARQLHGSSKNRLV